MVTVVPNIVEVLMKKRALGNSVCTDDLTADRAIIASNVDYSCDHKFFPSVSGFCPGFERSAGVAPEVNRKSSLDIRSMQVKCEQL